MAELPPLSTPQTVSSGNAPQPGLSVQQAPPALTQPHQPVQLSGVVVTAVSGQQMTIETPQGQVTVQTAAPLPPDTPVSLELYTVNAQTRATVTVVRQAAIQAQSRTLDTLLQTVAPKALPALQENSVVTALRLPPPPQDIVLRLAAALPPLKGDLKTPLPLLPDTIDALFNAPDRPAFLRSLPPLGFQAMQEALLPQRPAPPDEEPLLQRLLPARLISALLPSAADKAAPGKAGILDVLLAQMQGPASGQKSASARAFTPPLPTAQNTVRLHILRLLPPETPEADVEKALAALPAKSVTARIEAAVSDGRPLLQTKAAYFILTEVVKVPVGTKVILAEEPAEEIRTAPAAIKAAVINAPLSGLPEASAPLFAALQEALEAFPADTPQAAALARSLPAPSHMAPAVLFFMAALRTGAVENWLGADTLSALRQAGKKPVADALAGGFEKAAAQAKEAPAGDWRALSVPFRAEDQIIPLQFYIRRQEDAEKEEPGKTGGGRRFILNLNLSRLGALQLDGFIRKKSFDAILRTEEKLPFDMRQELMQRFAKGLEQAGLQGGLGFQAGRQGWVVPEAATHSQNLQA